jgi:uncharacterized protein
MVTLADMMARRREARERERLRVAGCLRDGLVELLQKGSHTWVYGSLVRPGRFHDESDIDLAVEDETRRIDLVNLMNELSLRTGRSVDVCRLSETRLSGVIRREGERWTL